MLNRCLFVRNLCVGVNWATETDTKKEVQSSLSSSKCRRTVCVCPTKERSCAMELEPVSEGALCNCNG